MMDISYTGSVDTADATLPRCVNCLFTFIGSAVFESIQWAACVCETQMHEGRWNKRKEKIRCSGEERGVNRKTK